MNLRFFCLIFLVSLLFGCYPDNNVYYPDRGGTYRPSYDPYGYQYEYERDRARWEREQLRNERERLERERERIRWEQEQLNKFPSNPSLTVRDSCDPGFSLRGSKCSNQERQRGCKDTRSKLGQQYCVKF